MSLSPSMLARLQSLKDRHEELSVMLSDPEVIGQRERFRQLSQEYAELEPVARVLQDHQQLRQQIEGAKALLDDADPDMRQLAEADIEQLTAALEKAQAEMRQLLIPRDPDDSLNVFLEVRAGTGGDEAALFAGDLFRMYSRYAEIRGWQLDVLNERPGEHGGFKEIIARISGRDVYRELKFESGAHRVQRVPETEAQGRIHTSACTVAILPEPEVSEDIEINRNELRIDTFRASGAGGQHVNKTDSAIRLTHIPTGIVVECQDERSQHKNRAKAMALLQARLNDAARQKQEAEQAESRRNLVGSGDRSERIRTYNFPQGRVTDHRIGLTLYKLSEVMEGELGAIIEPLMQEYQADQLAALGEA